MNSTFVAFITLFAAGVVVSIFSKWAEVKYQLTALDKSSSRRSQYSRKVSALIGALAVFIAWMSLLWFFSGLLIVNITDIQPNNDVIVFYPLAILMVGAPMYLYYGLSLKCDCCERRILMQDSEQQKYAIKGKIYRGWAFVVIQILFKKMFQCMSCGKKYTV